MLDTILYYFDYNKFLFYYEIYWNFPIPYLWTFKIWLIMNVMLVILLSMLYMQHLKNQKYYMWGFLRKYSWYLLWWLQWEGKSRLMTKILMDIKKNYKNTMIISNYYNDISDVEYSSFKDFYLLQRDIQAISLYLNFDIDEKREIEKKFPWYFNYDNYAVKYKKEFKKIKELTGWKLDFASWNDEFHNYFYWRLFMSNYSNKKEEWIEIDWKKLLEIMHQQRHNRQLSLCASQDTDSMDYDLRTMADKEIEVKEWLYWLVYWFNLYKYLTSKYQNKAKELYFMRINKFLPFIFFNWYIVHQNIKNIKTVINEILNKLTKNRIKIDKNITTWFEGYILPYNTNFNVNIRLSIYHEWDLFYKIIEKFDKF